MAISIYIRQKLLTLPATERAELISILQHSLTDVGRPTTDEQKVARMQHLSAVMTAVTGVDPRKQCRKTEYLVARAAFVTVARREGVSQTAIGDFLGLNHSSVCCVERTMRDAFEHPRWYPQFIETYNKFIEAL